MNPVWVIAEQWQGRLTDITYEVLALGREVADALGAPLEAILVGQDGEALAAGLGRADVAVCLEHPALAEPVPQLHAEALAALAAERPPEVILVPVTNLNMGVSTLLAARLKAPGINFTVDLKVTAGILQARCVLYGGKLEARLRPVSRPVVFGLWPGSRPAESGRSEQAPRIERVAAVVPEDPRVRMKRYIEPEAGDVDLTRQHVLVAVGRGIQSQDNLEPVEELAAVLGGAVCGSRPVIDQGWLPLSRQIGKSGVSVKPKLYLAAGISGAPEHVEGMKDSSLIVAINTDPRAPIFNIAHYGIVGDVLEVLPALTQALRARKG